MFVAEIKRPGKDSKYIAKKDDDSHYRGGEFYFFSDDRMDAVLFQSLEEVAQCWDEFSRSLEREGIDISKFIINPIALEMVNEPKEIKMEPKKAPKKRTTTKSNVTEDTAKAILKELRMLNILKMQEVYNCDFGKACKQYKESKGEDYFLDAIQ